VSVGLGFSLRSLAGSVVGKLLFPGGQNVVGPRLADLNVSSSANGSPFPDGIGHYRIGGQIIDAQQIQQHKKNEKISARGGPTQTTYSYTWSGAISFGRGPGDVLQIWADSKLIYDITGSGEMASWGCVHPNPVQGTKTQRQDPTLVAFRGANATPAYRDHVKHFCEACSLCLLVPSKETVIPSEVEGSCVSLPHESRLHTAFGVVLRHQRFAEFEGHVPTMRNPG
jgi:hypothetical protein